MGENNTNNKARFTARGGIYVALSLFLLYSTSFFPFNTIFILGLTSAIIPLSILTTNIQNSVVVILYNIFWNLWICKTLYREVKKTLIRVCDKNCIF